MPVETLQNHPILKQYDVLISPDPGGRFEPDFSLDNTAVIARGIEPNLPLEESHKPHLEQAPGLIFNPELQKAGWDSRLEMARFIRHANTQTVELSAEELEANIRAYHSEIIQQKPVLPHLNSFAIHNGVLRMVGQNKEPVADAISPQERKGAVRQASLAIENFLLSAPNDSYAVLMSPAGWNGFVDENGSEAEPHLNAQTLIFWKDPAGILKGLTLVTDLAGDQAEELMIGLGVVKEKLGWTDEHERLTHIVRNPALLSFPGSDATPFEYVLDKILAVRGRSPFRLMQRNGQVELRSVDRVREDIKRFDELLQFSMEEERLVTEPKQFILDNSERLREGSIQQEIINKIERAILLLARNYLEKTGVYFKSMVPVSLPVILPFGGVHTYNDFAPEIVFLQSRAGCPPRSGVAGRSLRGASLGSSFSAGLIDGSATFGESDSMGSLYFPCPACGVINKRPREGYVERCQNPDCISPEAVCC